MSKPTAGSGPYRGHASTAVQETRTELTRERHPSGIEIDRCRTCSGAFLDRGELEKIERYAGRNGGDGNARALAMFKRANVQAHRPSDGTPEGEPVMVPCPSCSEPMFEREWGQTLVMVDVCLDCRGVWVDQGELEAIESFFGV